MNDVQNQTFLGLRRLAYQQLTYFTCDPPFLEGEIEIQPSSRHARISDLSATCLNPTKTSQQRILSRLEKGIPCILGLAASQRLVYPLLRGLFDEEQGRWNFSMPGMASILNIKLGLRSEPFV